MPLRNKTLYTRLTNSSLWILWVGALLLLLAMFYNWKSADPKIKGIFVDQLLLSSQDLKLGESVNLINISLKGETPVKTPDQDSIVNTPPERKLLYSKILKKKIKEITTAPTKDKENDGFIIKPIPQ